MSLKRKLAKRAGNQSSSFLPRRNRTVLRVRDQRDAITLTAHVDYLLVCPKGVEAADEFVTLDVDLMVDLLMSCVVQKIPSTDLIGYEAEDAGVDFDEETDMLLALRYVGDLPFITADFN